MNSIGFFDQLMWASYDVAILLVGCDSLTCPMLLWDSNMAQQSKTKLINL